MIFSRIDAKNRVETYPPLLEAAIAYCSDTDFSAIAPGTYPLQDDDMYVMVMDFTSKPKEAAHPERHESYIDVQFWPEGEEYFGIAPYTEVGPLVKAAPERDVWLYESAANESFLHATAGCYAVFFPEDVHRPGVCVGSPSQYRKVVIKIKVSALTASAAKQRAASPEFFT